MTCLFFHSCHIIKCEIMSVVKKLVPWSNWSEWRYVKSLLYSDDVKRQWDGVHIVKAWKCRASDVPVAIESTALFTELIIKIDKVRNERGLQDADSRVFELHYAAALAIIRMVNGMIDVEQKGEYSRSVNSIAREINLPRYVVDLRHRCTHSDMPSFERVYEAIQGGKKWLYYAYWTVLSMFVI